MLQDIKSQSSMSLCGCTLGQVWPVIIGVVTGVPHWTLQRSEAKAPFRLARLIGGSGLLLGALVGLVIISARLVQGLQGKDDSVFFLRHHFED